MTIARSNRRSFLGAGLGLPLGFGLGTDGMSRQSATPAATPVGDPATTIESIAEAAMVEMDLRAVLVRCTVAGENILTQALGESLTGVPATTDMHVRNGAVAISYVSTVLLRLVDEGVVALDDTIDRWLTDFSDAGSVTLRMLANMTAGYPDFVPNPDFNDAFYRDPFRKWSTDELLAYSFEQPRLFDPGTNWDYSHSDYVILGLVLEAATGRSMAELMRVHIIEPLGLSGTASEQTGWMPQPVLHAYSSERRVALGVPASTPFYEESTFWNPSWTLPEGAVQYSTVTDMADSMAAIARGDLLSPSSHAEQVSRDLLGFGAPLEGCRTCHTLDEAYLYGLGIIRSGGWLLQNPLFGGYGGAAGYHPDSGTALAVVTTFGPGSFTPDSGDYAFGNASQTIFRRISEALTPDSPMLLS